MRTSRKWRVASGRRRAKIGQRGSALLAVLWLSAALTAIAFSVAATVRSETERASTTSESTRAYYLASGSIERAALWMFWTLAIGIRDPAGAEMFYKSGSRLIEYDYPTGHVAVEVVPEGGKLNVNIATGVDLNRLLLSLGVQGERAEQIASGIIQWRTFAEANTSPVTTSGGGSSFQPRHASLEELEEILLIPGMTPEIFYGRYDHEPSGRLIPRGGLRDCLTVWGTGSKIDVNTAPPALLESVGVPAEIVKVIIARRPFGSMDEVAPLVPDQGVFQRLGIAGSTIWTLRATARIRKPDGTLSDLRKTVAATVKLLDINVVGDPYHIMRWYDDAWSPVSQTF